MAFEVRVLEELHCFHAIDAHDEPYIPGIRFLCERVSNTESPIHTKFLWLTEEELHGRDASEFAGDLRDEALKLLERFRSSGAHGSPRSPGVRLVRRRLGPTQATCPPRPRRVVCIA